MPLVVNLTGSVWFFWVVGKAGEFCVCKGGVLWFCLGGGCGWGRWGVWVREGKRGYSADGLCVGL